MKAKVNKIDLLNAFRKHLAKLSCVYTGKDYYIIESRLYDKKRNYFYCNNQKFYYLTYKNELYIYEKTPHEYIFADIIDALAGNPSVTNIYCGVFDYIIQHRKTIRCA